MQLFGKMSQSAISIMSFLAKNYGHQTAPMSSHLIAEASQISQSLAAKILTSLSNAEIVRGASGPRGGYELAREPKDISLFDIVAIFEKSETSGKCPFTSSLCGNDAPCELHKELSLINQKAQDLLKKNTLSIYSKREFN